MGLLEASRDRSSRRAPEGASPPRLLSRRKWRARCFSWNQRLVLLTGPGSPRRPPPQHARPPTSAACPSAHPASPPLPPFPVPGHPVVPLYSLHGTDQHLRLWGSLFDSHTSRQLHGRGGAFTCLTHWPIPSTWGSAGHLVGRRQVLDQIESSREKY